MSFDAAHCTLCPRQCSADRTNGVGACHCGTEIRIARAALHYWEEPCISGKDGSGAVFFAGCALGCVFCQNKEISRRAVGKVFTVGQLADAFLRLQEQNANNINLVTGSHFTPWIVQALELAKPKLHIPVVWNCGGYESLEILHMLDGLVDIYLPDLKFYTAETAKAYANCCLERNFRDVSSGRSVIVERRFAGTWTDGAASGSAGASKRVYANFRLAGRCTPESGLFAELNGTIYTAR